jgi:uncharacterized protein (DUF362 family)
MGLDNKKVAVAFTDLKDYPNKTPFDPPERYPEYAGHAVDPDNQVYPWVRYMLHRLGLDQENFDTLHWNPLKDIVEPGMTVLIKPNTVRHNHLECKNVFSVIIHASIMRPILDYICIALKNRGRIVIGDSPTIASLFDKTMAISQIDGLLAWYRHQTPIPIECMDFRTHRAVRTWMYGRWGRKKVASDPQGYQFVNLGNQSYFNDIDPKRLRIGVASHRNMYRHHSGGRHEYLFPKSVLECDAIISIPKMKTHRRTAVTLALKDFMGLPAWKDSLPHFRIGSAEEGGDQYIYPSWRKRVHTKLDDQLLTQPLVPVKFLCAFLEKAIWYSHWVVPFKDDIQEAMWYGNDTVWRTVLDIHRAVFYADRNGKLCDTPQRRYFCLLDGIIGGEKSGPSSPDPVASGVLMAGFNPVACDAVAASLMGFDINRIPLIKKGLEEGHRPRPVYNGTPDDIEVIDGADPLNLSKFQERRNLKFEPHPNWKGHVERE